MYVVLDIGGTKTRVAISVDGENIGEPNITKTPQDFDEGVELIKRTITEMVGDEKIDVIAGGAAGSLNKTRDSFYNAPHLPEWNGKPLKKELENAFEVPVYLENDTAMVGLGEASRGAGKDYQIVAYLTISTGVGGVRVVNKKLDEHAMGFEPGHQIIMCATEGTDKDISECPSCLMFGHLEGFIGGAALKHKYSQDPSEIKDSEVWDDVSRYLSYGLNNTLVYWSPDIVVLGGGLITHGAVDIERTKKYLDRIVKIYPELPPIVKAECGDLGGLYGSLTYIRNNVK